MQEFQPQIQIRSRCKISVCLCAVVMVLMGSVFAAPAQEKAELRKSQTKAWSLFYKGKLADARNVLLPLTKSRHEDVRMEAFHCMARVFWKEGSERGKMEANKIWNKIETKSTAYAHQDRMAIAKSLRLAGAGKLQEAERILDPLLGKQHQSTATAEAALVYADVLIKLKNFKRAAKAAGFAEGFLKSKAGRELGDSINPFVEASRAMQKKVQIASRPKPAPKPPKTPKPKDPAAELFKKAEALRGKKQYAKAMYLYHQVMEHYKDSPYAPRSELHTGHCYLGSKRIDDAISVWDEFTRKSPSGPWRGQAYVELIDTALAYKFDPDQADTFAEQAQAGLEKPTSDSSWKGVMGELHLRFGILALTKNEGAAAATHLNTAMSHIKKPSKQMRVSMKRLLHAAKDKGTALPADVVGEAKTEKQEGLQTKSVRLLSVATMLCLLDKNSAALELAGNLVAKGRGFNAPQKSYAAFIFGLARRRVPGKPGQANAEAMAALKKSLAMCPKGSWHDETLYHSACCYLLEARQNYWRKPPEKPWKVSVAERQKKDPKDLEAEEKRRAELQTKYNETRGKSLQAWSKLVKLYPKSPRSAEAYFNMGRILWSLNKHEQSVEMLNKVAGSTESDWLVAETHLLLGIHALEYEVDREKAWKYFSGADEWIMGQYKEMNNNPDKALDAHISKPLWSMNVLFPGPIEHEQKRNLLSSEELRWWHCSKWYLDLRRARCARYMGFLLFVVGKYDDAKEMYANVLKYDPDVAKAHNKSEFNDYSRLTKACELKYFCAYPEELKVFEGRHLLAVYLMDFYYCTERWREAEAIARRMIAGDFGKLTTGQKTYPQCMIGNCVYWTRGRALAASEYGKAFGRDTSKLDGKEVSASVDRAAYCAGNVASQSFNPKVYDWGLKVLKKLTYSGRRNIWVYQAILCYAGELIVKSEKQDNVREGIRLLNEFPEEKEGYGQVAKTLVKDYQVMRENRRKNLGEKNV